jgi:hypothetical protein
VAACVIAAVNLDYELGGGRREVGDVVAEWNLAAERDTETPTADFRPELCFRRRECGAHLPSPQLDDRTTMSRSIHAA